MIAGQWFKRRMFQELVKNCMYLPIILCKIGVASNFNKLGNSLPKDHLHNFVAFPYCNLREEVEKRKKKVNKDNKGHRLIARVTLTQ